MFKLDRFLLNYNGNKYNETKKYLSNYLNKDYDIICEPFCGIFGFSRYFIEYNQDYKGEIWLNDINKDLIDTMKILQSDPSGLFVELENLLNKYNTDKELSNYLKDKKTEHKYIGTFRYICRTMHSNFYEVDKAYTKINNYKKYIEYYKIFFKKVKFFNLDCKDFINKIPKNKKSLVFFDPPYFDSYNVDYINSNGRDNNLYYDNTTIYIDILKTFKKKNIDCLMIINKSDLIHYLFKKYLKTEYKGQYSNTILLPNKVRKNIKWHMVYDNFSLKKKN